MHAGIFSEFSFSRISISRLLFCKFYGIYSTLTYLAHFGKCPKWEWPFSNIKVPSALGVKHLLLMIPTSFINLGPIHDRPNFDCSLLLVA